MFILAILWLVYLVLELTKGLTQTQERLVTAIWVLFIFEFLLKFILAPRKRQYVMHNWLTIVALVIPALRVFRLVQAIRILQLSRVATTTKFVRALTSTKRFVAEVREAQGSAFYVEMERSLTNNPIPLYVLPEGQWYLTPVKNKGAHRCMHQTISKLTATSVVAPFIVRCHAGRSFTSL
jgi:hypothetical protein